MNRLWLHVLHRFGKLDQIIQYRRSHSSLPNIIRPKNFNEKIIWRMFFDRRMLLATTCDKLLTKELALERCPNLLAAETLWVGDNLRESLNSDVSGDWVLKEISGSGRIYFGSGIIDSATLLKMEHETAHWEKDNKHSKKRSWALSMAREGFFIERRISVDIPQDFKFHVFSGQVAFCGVDYSRFEDHRRACFNRDGDLIPVSYGFEVPDQVDPLPENYREMVSIAERLTAEFDYMRIDLYSIEDKVYFGEFTPYPARGRDKVNPAIYEKLWGDLWNLPKWRHRRSSNVPN